MMRNKNSFKNEKMKNVIKPFLDIKDQSVKQSNNKKLR